MSSTPRLHIVSYDVAQGVLASSAASKITHVISIGNPGTSPPPALEFHRGESLVLRFHDTDKASRDLVAPSKKDVSRILEFARGARAEHQFLVHCAMGISRSSAAALAIIASRLEPGETGARKALRRLLALKEMIHPNRRMVKLADGLLGYGGKLAEAHALQFRGGGIVFPVP